MISEVQGSSATVIKENKQNNAYQQKETEFIKKKSQEANNKLLEYKKKLIDSVGKAGYNGVNIFEGVQPIDEAPKENRAAPSAVEVLDPTNTGGINLNAIPGMNKWGSILKRVNEEKE